MKTHLDGLFQRRRLGRISSRSLARAVDRFGSPLPGGKFKKPEMRQLINGSRRQRSTKLDIGGVPVEKSLRTRTNFCGNSRRESFWETDFENIPNFRCGY